MKTLKNLWWVGAIAALAACNPYSAENTAAPNVLASFATGGNAGAATDVTVADGTYNATTKQWEIESTSTCYLNPAGTTAADPAAYVEPDSFLVWVKTDKLLDGASVQQNASSCVPAGDWLKVEQTTTASATPVDVSSGWYTCYMPGSPSANEGSSIVFYRSDPRVGGTAPGDVSADGGWYDMADRDPAPYSSSSAPHFTTWVNGDAKEFTTLTFVGEVKDRQGHPLPINIAYTIDPDAGAIALALKQPTISVQPPTPSGKPTPAAKTIPDPFVGTSTGVSGTDTAPVVSLQWSAAACATAAGATYIVQRKELSEASYTTLTGADSLPAATVALDDATTTYGKQYTYRIRESIAYTGQPAGEPFVKTLSSRKVTVLLPPAKPTAVSTPSTSGSITVTWTAVPSATSYTVQRSIANETAYVTAPDGTTPFPVPGSTWVTVKTTSDATTLTIPDTGRTVGAKYFYRIIARAVVGQDADGADVIGTSEPSPTSDLVVAQ